jgi:asparagine synthase (glutamine-hydrolysing)
MRVNKKLSAYSPLFDFGEPEELLIRWKGWTKDEISMLCNTQCDFSHTRFYTFYQDNIQKHPYDLYRRLLSAMQDDRIHLSAIQCQLDVAFPFWDQDVREFTDSLPIAYKYNNGISKILFRKVLEDIIPPHIWDKPKHGFDYPFEQLLRHNEYELTKMYLSEESLKEHGYFDITIVNDYLRRFSHGDDEVKFKIWALVLFQAWYHRHYRASFL